MKWAPLAAAMSAAALLSACSGVPPARAPQAAASADYAASGDSAGVRAFVYGKRTVLEFGSRPLWLSVTDENGVAVPYEREGRYVRLGRKLERFSVWANLRSVSFVHTGKPGQPAAVAVQAAPAPAAAQAKPAALAPLTLTVEGPDQETAALVQLVARQLKEARAAIAAGPAGAQTDALAARLERVEARLAGAATATVRVQFDTAETVFEPDPRLLQALLPAARSAERITIRGRTDARVAGRKDAEIALGRAQAVRRFLVENGVARERIRLYALPAGDFIAPAESAAGRALNRRVDIELVNRRYAGIDLKAALAELRP